MFKYIRFFIRLVYTPLAEKKPAIPEKELYDHTEKVVLLKGKIQVLLQNEILYEAIEEKLYHGSCTDAYYYIPTDYSGKHQDLKNARWIQGAINQHQTIQSIFKIRVEGYEGNRYFSGVEGMQGKNFVFFAEKFINKDQIKTIELIDVCPGKTVEITYKRFKE